MVYAINPFTGDRDCLRIKARDKETWGDKQGTRLEECNENKYKKKK